MNNDLALSRLFCEKHPSDAASLMVRLPPEYIAGYLSSLAPDRVIPLMQHMPTAYATQLLAHLEVDFSARLLSQADFSTTARLLRPLSVPQRQPYMTRMTATQNAQLSRILNYAPGSVGNLVEIPPLTALGDWTVKHAKRELKKIHNRSLYDIPVVNDEHGFLGLVKMHALLVETDGSRMMGLCEDQELALPAYAAAAAIINHPSWSKHLSLPVIDRGGILLGVLYHATLKSYVQDPAHGRGQDMLAPVMALAELYWAASSSIVETISRKRTSPPKQT